MDLFDQSSATTTDRLREMFDAWALKAGRGGKGMSQASCAIYEDMWLAFGAWCTGNHIDLTRLVTADLDAFLASRGGHDDLSARYTHRLLTLIDRVMLCDARSRGAELNDAAANLLASRRDIKHANAAARDPLPEYLVPADAKVLISYLSAARPRPGRETGHSWREVRNRTAVALHLGAGLTPSEVRSLRLSDVNLNPARSAVPCEVRVRATDTTREREAPVAPWAGQLLLHWISVRAEQSIVGDILFPSTRSGGAWKKTGHFEIVASVLKEAGVESDVGGAFRLRHTFALRQLRRGQSPAEVARWLGVEERAMARYSMVVPAPVDVV